MTVHSRALGTDQAVEPTDETQCPIWTVTLCGQRISGHDQFIRRTSVVDYTQRPTCRKCLALWEANNQLALHLGYEVLRALAMRGVAVRDYLQNSPIAGGGYGG